jgi:hypothetical protein
MDANLILIDSAAELARARALVDRLWESDDPADIAHDDEIHLLTGLDQIPAPR